MEKLEGWLTLLKLLFVYNVWVVPAGIENDVKERLLMTNQFLANVVTENAEEPEA